MKNMIKNICGIAIILYVILITKFSMEDAITYSISVSVFLYFLYDKLLWRFNPFNNIPKIYGCYTNVVESTYNGGVNYESYVFIKQTRSKITITEKMGESACVSIVSSLYRYNEDDNQWFLYYTYLTHPQNPKDDMHFGTSILHIKDEVTLEGFYFTNRVEQTKGKQVFKKINKKSKP